MPGADAARIFTGIGSSYDRVAAVLSFGQDPRWRHALVNEIRASPTDTVLDVATGTGMVAAELVRAYRCRVTGIDQSADMLAVARRRDGVYADLVEGRAESLPFADASFDHVTFTYLLRYVDDPAATMRELVRVLRPGGRIASVEFALPDFPWRPLWWLYTRVGLPLLGRVVSSRWMAVGAFLGPSIERFYRAHPQSIVERYWREAGLVDVRARRMSLGGGVVMSATKAPGGEPRPAALAPAFYAMPGGRWRDYWTLLHPPYTAWHLSYVALGAALAPHPDPRVVGAMLLAFALAVGLGAHAFDELRGRPLRTRIPDAVLVAIGSFGLATALAIGALGAVALGPALLLFVAAGGALVLLYAFEAPLVHSDAGFGIAWGAFPVLTAAYATGAAVLPALALAGAAAVVSLAQRRLSTPVRRIRRAARAVTGEVVWNDGAREPLDARTLIAAPEDALRLLWIAMVLLAAGALLARYVA